MSSYDTVQNQIKYIKKINPDVIYGYSQSIKLIAKEVYNKSIEGINPKIIFGTAELLDKDTREFINSVFDVEMVDLFGNQEFIRTAWECNEHMEYHIDIDNVVMDFLKDGESVVTNERGEIIYTGLHNYAMPFIRYRSNDIGVPMEEKCSCGRGLPLMKSIEGRAWDFIKLPSGRIFPPAVTSTIMRSIPEISEFQIIQKRLNELCIKIVKNEKFPEKRSNEIENEIKKQLLGEEDITIKIKIVEKIPKIGRKQRTVISKIRGDF